MPEPDTLPPAADAETDEEAEALTPQEAIEKYTAEIAAQPDDATAYLNRGSAHYNAGALDAAIADYRQAIKLDPTLAEAYASRGYALFGSACVRLAQHAIDTLQKLRRGEWLGDVALYPGKSDVNKLVIVDFPGFSRHNNHRDVLHSLVAFHRLVDDPAGHVGHHQLQ